MGVNLLVSDCAPIEWSSASVQLTFPEISHDARPVLMLHGENDARVPLSQATGFHRALRRQGVPVEFVVYPREPHSVAERAHQLDILKRVRRWYDRWLKG